MDPKIYIHVYPPVMIVLEKIMFQSCIYYIFPVEHAKTCLIALLRYNYWTRLQLYILFIDFERSTGLGSTSSICPCATSFRCW